MSDAPLPQLSDEAIRSLKLPLDSVFAAIEKALVEHAKRNVEMPPKIGVHPRAGTFIHAMPACVPALGLCGMKWVSGYPDNAARHLPTVAGLLVLNDPETGLPYALLDAQWITAIRTAVVSALIVRCCPPAHGRSLGLAGCGVQGRHHLRCLLHVLPAVDHVRLYDVREEAARSVREESSSYTSAAVEVVPNPEACLRGADVMATCTSGRLDVQDDWMSAGTTAVAVDSHVACGRLFGNVKLITDDEQQARQFEKQGKYPGGLPPVHAELGKLLTGARPGREHQGERILGLPLGLAIADLAVAQLIWQTHTGRRSGK